MPFFDLRGIKVAKYENTDGVVSYGTTMSAGDAMTCALELRFAEGRLYAESTLAEYLKKATGGTISMGVKYIPAAAQELMYGVAARARTIGGKAIQSLGFTGRNVANYVGTGFYAPDMIDGVEKYTAVFAYRALFGPPSMSFQTLGENIEFQTPTTTGEFLADHSDDKNLFEVAVADTEEDAKAWIDAMFAGTPVDGEAAEPAPEEGDQA